MPGTPDAPGAPGARAEGGESCGGRRLTGACCTVCAGKCSAAGATLPALPKTCAGTTVAAPRLAKFCCLTCAGGSGVRPAAPATWAIVAAPPLVMVRLPTEPGTRVELDE